MAFTGIVTNKVIQYIKKKYGAEPEFLWAKTPDNAIFRHKKRFANKESSKWFAALLTIPKIKLSIKGGGNIEILNLKCDPVLTSLLIDGKNIFPAFHMNKEHWITVLLDGSVKNERIFPLIDFSYNLTKSGQGKLKNLFNIKPKKS